ncbi:glycerate kinase [Corynebacterium pseudodiphtheriticum]|uniref:glycerate kinase n=1 Tax=Corynebacterium pseudodiphtheriticum TaxID=37637 RepID=UPI00234C2011|nr:glycerate kinase [Corynebacterium pseudodiphtheriticum]MDC7068821.1 glycerate kinase [Corynebacterium pseudodiphtheriticum]MDC7084887.1 glycerate kinase [Corynebacterium pseudodiphtheriticum]MDC7086851.1 glycerate kinase [Corynebacterium pseudodiphtheriticum]
MNIVIAPDSFKGFATSEQAAAWLADGVAEVFPNAAITTAGMADGGEGTAERFSGETITLPTTDAAGRLTEASYRYDRATKTAYIDIAAASGLPAVADKLDALSADTYGTGVLIADAQTRGAQRVVLGLGGSATTDGGMGILVALGAAPHDKRGYPLPKGGGPLDRLEHIDTANLNVAAAGMEFVLLADTTAPACGPYGSAEVFSRQKGADDERVAHLDGAMRNLCEVTGVDPDAEFMGAAGATPVGLIWLSRLIYGTDDHVHLLPGAAVVAQELGLPAAITQADLVITGEGRFDEQSSHGKVISQIAQLVDAAGQNTSEKPGPVLAIAAAEFGVQPGDNVFAVQLKPGKAVADQLRAAGAEIARKFQQTRL